MNTPDKCEYCSAREQEHGYGVICEHTTPDTEWEKEFDRHFLGSDPFDEHTKEEIESGTWAIHAYAVKKYIRTLLTSRDTYWKERVEEIYSHFSWCRECAEGATCKDALAIKDNLK